MSEHTYVTAERTAFHLPPDAPLAPTLGPHVFPFCFGCLRSNDQRVGTPRFLLGGVRSQLMYLQEERSDDNRRSPERRPAYHPSLPPSFVLFRPVRFSPTPTSTQRVSAATHPSLQRNNKLTLSGPGTPFNKHDICEDTCAQTHTRFHFLKENPSRCPHPPNHHPPHPSTSKTRRSRSSWTVKAAGRADPPPCLR